MEAESPIQPVPSSPLAESVRLPLLALLLFALNLFCQTLVAQVIVETRFLGCADGEANATLAKATEDSPERKLARSRLGMWTTALSLPLFLATLPLLFRLLPDTNPRDFGLTLDNWRSHALSGLLRGLLLTPAILGVNLAVIWLYKVTVGEGAEEHPFTLLAGKQLMWWEWAMLFVGACMAAPFYEELLFRGVLQRWFATSDAAPWIGFNLAAGMALLIRWQGIATAWHDSFRALALALMPLAWVGFLFAIFIVVWLRGGAKRTLAILASSTLFAAIHSFAWPSPIPLTILALALGDLAWKQRSLAGAMAMHAVFNGASFLVLLGERLLQKG